jgi:hypothetical protein
MARSIGQGVQFLNRHLSAAMFSGAMGPHGHGGEGKAQLFEFLRSLKHRVRGWGGRAAWQGMRGDQAGATRPA